MHKSNMETREFLFRGQTRRYSEKLKNVAGDPMPSNWVYGGIFPQNDDGDFAIIYTQPECEKRVVYADTVGQYTGVNDKSGIKIFEYDICKDSLGTIFVVEWDKKNARFLGYTKEHRIVYIDKEPRVEVIGNIFDNPELLKGSKK